MSRRLLIQAFVALLWAGALTGGSSGCNSKPAAEASSNASSERELPPLVDTPYSVWPTGKTITATALGEMLKQNEDAASALCQADSHRPGGYSRHFALVSTPSFDRINAAAKYGLDPSLPVAFGDTGRMLAPNLGDFLAQKGMVDPNNSAGRDLIKLTFSEGGKFTGFCEATNGYVSVVNVVRDDGSMQNFATSCSQDAVVVCMSVR